MSDSYCYIGNGANDVWELPFTPKEEPVVSLVAQNGLEKRLLLGRDYQLLGSRIIIMLGEGERLYVQAAAQSQARTYGASLQPATAQGIQYAKAASLTEEEAGAALERRYQELSARLRQNLEAESEALAQDMRAALKKALEEGLASLGELIRRGRDEAGLAHAARPERGRFILPSDCGQGTYLTIPCAYYPGTGSLQVYINGLLAAPDADYEECGPANEASRTIRLLHAQEAGTVFDFIVAQISSSTAALQAADSARAAQRAAAVLLQNAEAEQAQAYEAQAAATTEMRLAQGWAQAAETSADNAYKAAVHAWDLAGQISLYRREPGISAVKDIADIHACSPGLFIINKHITHAPTPFFGVWPAQCIGEMQWDGVFFLGGKCYPDDPALPPKRPPRPKPELPAEGAADDWLPCGHSHQTPPPPCPDNCIAWPPRPKACDCAKKEE